MYRRILVPVDGSSTSMRGVEHALALAKNQRARLRLLNVIDEEVIVPGMDPYAPLDMTPLIDGVKTEGQKGLKKTITLAARRKIRTDVAILRSRGLFVSEVILSDARKWRADLIVMGTHGRRGFNRLLMGSDAERVLRDTPVPILLVRADDSTESTGKRKRGPRTRRSA